MLGFNLDIFSKRFPVKKRANLDLLTELLNKLGSPHLRLPPTIHVAGTNGKGSTVAFLRAIFESAGYKPHVYTSPHLIKVNERIVIAGKEIETPYLTYLIRECEKYAKDLRELTWFELLTATAFLAYAQNSADVLLLETGVGGRLDATNVIHSPLVTAITPISYDHMNSLGKTLSEIAYAKAGIFKAGTPAFSTLQFKEVTHTLIECAKHLSIPFFLENQDWNVHEDQGKLTYNSTLKCTNISLKGKHQFQNAGLALSIASFLENTFNFKEEHLKQGIATATWEGRLQNITSTFLTNCLAKGSEIWLDSAHNEGGARALIETVRTWNFLPTYFVVGMLNHKDPQVFLSILSEIAQRFYFIPIVTSDKHVLPKDFIKIILPKDGFVASGVIDALQKIAELSSSPVRVIICGSVYLAGDVLNMVDKQNEETP